MKASSESGLWAILISWMAAGGAVMVWPFLRQSGSVDGGRDEIRHHKNTKRRGIVRCWCKSRCGICWHLIRGSIGLHESDSVCARLVRMRFGFEIDSMRGACVRTWFLPRAVRSLVLTGTAAPHQLEQWKATHQSRRGDDVLRLCARCAGGS